MILKKRARRYLAELFGWLQRRLAFLFPLYGLARIFGVRARPLHQIGFWRLAFHLGTAFGLWWGLAMWFVYWRSQGVSGWSVLGVSCVAGFLFGVCMAGYFRWKAGR